MINGNQHTQKLGGSQNHTAFVEVALPTVGRRV